MRLTGRVALVTGASAGIGRATALALAREGADVALNYLSLADAAEELAGQIRALGRRALLLPVDVSDQAAVEAMVARTAGELGRLDIFVSSAVYSDREPFHTADMAGFRRTIDVTMWGAFYVLRAAVNVMIRQGQGGNAVLVSSPQAHIAIPGSMAYNMPRRHSIRWRGRPPWSCSRTASGSTSSIPAGPTRPASANTSLRTSFAARVPPCRGAAWPNRRRSPAASSSWSIRTRTTSPAVPCRSTGARNCLGGPGEGQGNSDAASRLLHGASGARTLDSAARLLGRCPRRLGT
ncbi:MAG TPA: SDR family NAD(P)-dependent oxidoreductase [Gemmataceae bacterium]|nr:SDR family NAD(P)-dependent oxidoreductase [Gemmataceae bacterium]